MRLRRDFGHRRWQRGALISRGDGRCWLVEVYLEPGKPQAVYFAAASLARARSLARHELRAPLHWDEHDDALVGYYLRRNERRRHPRLFELEGI